MTVLFLAHAHHLDALTEVLHSPSHAHQHLLDKLASFHHEGQTSSVALETTGRTRTPELASVDQLPNVQSTSHPQKCTWSCFILKNSPPVFLPYSNSAGKTRNLPA